MIWLISAAAMLLAGLWYAHLRKKKTAGYLSNRVKHRRADVFKWSDSLFGLGLVLSLSMALVAFNYTVYDKTVDLTADIELDDMVEIEIPITTHEKKEPIPPPPPVPEKIEIPEEEPKESVEFVDMSVEAPEVKVIEKTKPKAEVVPPPRFEPPERVEEVEEILSFAAEMPRFPGCESEADKTKRKQCAQGKLMKFISGQIRYPTIAMENRVEGTVVARFVVSKSGEIEQATILRDIGAGCGDEVLRILDEMPEWIPGRQGNRNVSVWFTLPVKFRLN